MFVVLCSCPCISAVPGPSVSLSFWMMPTSLVILVPVLAFCLQAVWHHVSLWWVRPRLMLHAPEEGPTIANSIRMLLFKVSSSTKSLLGSLKKRA